MDEKGKRGRFSKVFIRSCDKIMEIIILLNLITLMQNGKRQSNHDDCLWWWMERLKFNKLTSSLFDTTVAVILTGWEHLLVNVLLQRSTTGISKVFSEYRSEYLFRYKSSSNSSSSFVDINSLKFIFWIKNNNNKTGISYYRMFAFFAKSKIPGCFVDFI